MHRYDWGYPGMPGVGQVIDLTTSVAVLFGVGYLIRYSRAARGEIRGEFEAQTILAKASGENVRPRGAPRHLTVVRDGRRPPTWPAGRSSSHRRQLLRAVLTLAALGVTLTPLTILMDPSTTTHRSGGAAGAVAPATPTPTPAPSTAGPPPPPTPAVVTVYRRTHRPHAAPRGTPTPPSLPTPKATRTTAPTPRATPRGTTPPATPTPTPTPTPTATPTPTPTQSGDLPPRPPAAPESTPTGLPTKLPPLPRGPLPPVVIKVSASCGKTAGAPPPHPRPHSGRHKGRPPATGCQRSAPGPACVNTPR